MAVFLYIKNILFVIFLLTITVAIFPLLLHNYPLELYYKDSIIYTTQNTTIIGITLISVLAFASVKVIYILLARGFFLKDIALFLIQPFFDVKKRNENVLDNIIRLRKKGRYKQALQITTNNFLNSNEILFQHFFLLLKLKKTRKFLNTFKNHQCGKVIPLFFALTKDWSHWRKNGMINRLYKRNSNNDVISYIYAKHLSDINQTQLAQKIVDDFLKNKFIFFREQYTFYLFNRLALQLEMNEYGNADFATSYIENIKNYHHSHVQKKQKNKK